MSKKKREEEIAKQQSLTAGQRKAAQRGEEQVYTEEFTAEDAERRKSFKKIMILAFSIVAVIVIVVGVVVPVWYISDYRYEKNPIAVIKLDNGMTLKYEIFAADAPRAAVNFIFLCNIGYFDGSIIYDTQESWVRFGGYYLDGEGKYAHRSADETFTSKTSSYFTDNAGEKQFKYRVQKDSTMRFTKGDPSTRYGLFSNYSTYCTEFEIMGIVDAYEKLSAITYNVQYLAAAYDDDTRANIDSILSKPQSGEFYKTYFKPPQPFVKIVSTKIHNYTVPYGESFEKYMTDNEYITTSWTGNYPGA